jgi:hypothetical protein
MLKFLNVKKWHNEATEMRDEISIRCRKSKTISGITGK